MDFAYYYCEWELMGMDEDYIPSAEAHEEGELPRALSETTLCVRYKGSADSRILRGKDISGDPWGDEVSQMVWGPGDELPYAEWERLAGTPERAMEALTNQQHEFDLVGPGAADYAAQFEVEEFVIGGPVA